MIEIKEGDQKLLHLQISLLRWHNQFSRLAKQVFRQANTWEAERLIEITTNTQSYINELLWELRRLQNLIYPGGLQDERES